MLGIVKIKGFKNFAKEIVFDFTDIRTYNFNPEAIKEGCVKNALVYGPNSCGKSNLGYGIFDIVINLTDKNKSIEKYYPYKNLYSSNLKVEFYYKFIFGKDVVEYKYWKTDVENIIYEKLIINNKTVLAYSKKTNKTKLTLNGTASLNRKLFKGDISFVKYVYKNTSLDDNDHTVKAFVAFYDFVERMLLFKSLKENEYIGLTYGRAYLSESIIKDGYIEDFQSFLAQLGIEYQLEADTRTNKDILAIFPNGVVNLYDVASTGTVSLVLFYYWYKRMQKASFVFIDEFDAFYHTETALRITKLLLNIKDTQVVLTTHNSDLMTTELLRPDCYYILNNGILRSVAASTAKELRIVHNLQKMYKAGAFY